MAWMHIVGSVRDFGHSASPLPPTAQPVVMYYFNSSDVYIAGTPISGNKN
jgi:hypothetical protein